MDAEIHLTEVLLRVCPPYLCARCCLALLAAGRTIADCPEALEVFSVETLKEKERQTACSIHRNRVGHQTAIESRDDAQE